MDSPSTPPYSRYAAVYDIAGQRAFGERLAGDTLGWLAERGIPVATGLDLACGTGAATLPLARAGLSMTGVDRSPEMIGAARSNVGIDDPAINWVVADMTAYVAPEPVDLVTCFYDAVNYLLDAESLAGFLSCAAASLRPGGMLAFDVLTRDRLREGWGAGAYLAVDRPDLLGIYRSRYDNATDLSPATVTFFLRDAENGSESCWRRFDEEHIERGWRLGDIEGALAAAGLDVVECRAASDLEGLQPGGGHEGSGRVVYFARKPAG